MAEPITTKRAAELLNISVSRVQQLARELDLPQFGKAFVITERDINQMRARKTKRGGPRRNTGEVKEASLKRRERRAQGLS